VIIYIFCVLYSLMIFSQKKSQSPGIDQIPAELMKAGSKTIRCEIRKIYYFYLE